MIKIYKLTAFMLLFLLGACSDETPIPEPGQTGSIENEGESRVTVLHLTSAGAEAWEPIGNADFRLVDPVGRHTLTFTGALRHDPSVEVLGNKGAATCRIAIGTTDIPDGTYYLSVSGEGVPSLGMRRVRFSANIGVEEWYSSMDYEDLEGSGTKDDPYLINDAGDFLTMLWYLEEDQTHAYGRYFLQTASFEVPRRSQIIDGHVYAPVTFSGHYDGGGNELTSLTYQGGGDPQADSNIGLFKELYSAGVENLTFTGAVIVNAHSNVGMLAGSASGDTYVSNVTISGSVIADGDNIGGLIGATEGNVTIFYTSLKSLIVNGSDTQGSKVGGILGSHSGGKINIDMVSTPDHIFSITGHDKVGGLVGEINTSQNVKIANTTLEHSVDRESSGVKVIYGSGKYTGGVIGYLSDAKPTMFLKLSIKAPVRGAQDVGGLVGHAEHVSEMRIDTAQLSSVVAGKVTIGGFFGYLGLSGKDCLLKFQGGESHYVIKSSTAADVKGETYVGGLIGYLEGNHGTITFDKRVEVAVNVSGADHVGGAVGYMNNVDDFNLDGLNFTSTTMRVSASTQYAGGVIGRAENSTVNGPVKLELTKGIPAASSLPSNFSGVVNAPTYAGGIAGSLTGTLTGAASNAQVTATSEWAGGICGYFHGTITQCAFHGDVTSPGGAGGIYAKCLSQTYVADCLNHADIKGGKWQGGIAAYTNLPRLSSYKIERCYNTGNLTDGCEVGGIAGLIWIYYWDDDSFSNGKTLEINECGNSGDIAANGDSSHSVGGIVGFVNFKHSYVHRCANHGKVSSSSVQYVIGGVVGNIGSTKGYNWNSVYECMNSGEVSCKVKSTKLGGVVGNLHSGNLAYTGEIRDCYNIGSMPSDQDADTGGILGYAANHTNIYRTFNGGKISHGNAAIGTHHSGSSIHHSNNYYLEGSGKSWPSSTSVPKDKLADKSVYHDFDFNNIWDITSDGPVLRHCPFQNIH